MKLLLLAFPLLVAVALARGATLGRVRGNAEENRSRKMSTQRRAKSSSGLFSDGKGKGSGIFHSKSSKSQYSGVFLGDLIEDPNAAEIACPSLASAPFFGCSHFYPTEPSSTCTNTLGYTILTPMCLAGADATACYDLSGAGAVTVRVQSAWDWSTYGLNKCATILTKIVADSITLETAETTGLCGDADGAINYPAVTGPWPTVDHTVTITLISTGTSYIGNILPGGTVCETPVTDVNNSRIPFEITIEGQDYEGYIDVEIDQNTLASAGNLFLLYEV